jgi:phage shock protein A
VNRRDLFKTFTAGAIASGQTAIASMTLENMRNLEAKISTLKTSLDTQISDLSTSIKGTQQRLDGLEKKQKVFASLVCAALLIG